MAITILPQQDLGELIGKGLGQGATTGFQQVADLKMREYQLRQEAALQQQLKNQQAQQNTQAWAKALGQPVDSPLAQLFGRSDPTVIRSLLDHVEGLQLGGSQGQQSQPQAQQGGSAGLQQLLGNLGQWQPSIGGQQAQAMQPEQQQQISPQAQQLGGGLHLGPGSQERRHREMLAEQKRKTDISEKRFEKDFGLKQQKAETAKESKEREQTFAEQKTVQPFLKKSAEDYQVHKKASHVAEEMKKILLAKHKQFPGVFMANAPEWAQEAFIRDKDVRNYMSKLNELVKLKAGATKGNVTNYKIQLEKLAKVKMNQPLQTQLELLDWVINDYNTEKDKQKFIAKSKNKKGHYPLDIEQQAIEYDLAQEDPLKYPQFFNENTQYEDDDGQLYVLKNKEWEPL